MRKVKLFYYFRSKSRCEKTYLSLFLCSHTILHILFKALKSFRIFFQFHDSENEIWNEVVILLLVALIFSPTVLSTHLSLFHLSLLSSTSPFLYLSIHLSTFLLINLSIYLLINLSNLYINKSIYLSIIQYIYLSINLSIYL